jgi:hypothetical protein
MSMDTFKDKKTIDDIYETGRSPHGRFGRKKKIMDGKLTRNQKNNFLPYENPIR